MLKQKGLTLVELLIALVIAVVVIAAAMSVYVSVVKTSRETLEQGRLDSELHKVVRAISRDVRRAGYWANATSSQTNPFTQAATDLTVNAAGNCILMSYDHNADGSLPAVNSGADDERYGFRLMNGAIQYRPASASFDCNASANSWVNLTDPNSITITAFTVTKNTNTASLIELRNVTLSISAQLTANAAITKSITQTIRVHNDKYVP